jgi:hypothetical protein
LQSSIGWRENGARDSGNLRVVSMAHILPSGNALLAQ